MGERRLRWKCRRILRELDVRPPIDVAELCRRLGEHRGRELRLVPYPLAVPGPFGVWFEADEFDAIAYQSQTSRAHQDHIVLHEVGHILAGHGGDATTDEDEPVLRDLPCSGTLRRMRRTCYDVRNEREAELIASIIGEGMGLLDAAPTLGHGGSGGSRVAGSLTHRPGWWT